MRLYRDVLTVDINEKGVVDVDTVKGCTAGMSARPGTGCYGNIHSTNKGSSRILLTMNTTTKKAHIPKFSASKFEMSIIQKIVERARKMDPDYSVIQATMDIEACHCNGTPLDLSRLLSAGDGDFGHDVFGIRRFIDRSTGEMPAVFSPRHSIS